jgi:uncharacterized membrane protein
MRSPLLRGALIANALFSFATGLLLVGFAEPVATVVGEVAPLVLRVIGAGLLPFAAFLVWTARRSVPRPVFVLVASIADLGWVAGSAGLLVFLPSLFSPAGTVAVAGVAGAVLVFGLLQLGGLRAGSLNRDGRTEARSAVEIRRRVAAPPDVVWAIVRDLETIGRYHPDLRGVEVTGERVGARRTCENRSGELWTEEVIHWDEEDRALTLRFDTDSPDFPYPVEEMVGGWRVEDREGASEVVVWFEYTVPGGILGEIAAPMIAARSRPVFEATLANMEAEAKKTTDEVPQA